MKRTFLRFTGKLWESDEFEPGIGWETERIAQRPRVETEGPYRVQLIDESGNVLVESPIEMRVDACRRLDTERMARTRIVGYVPLHPDSHTMQFVRGDRVLHRTLLARERPTITIVELEVDAKGQIRMRWDANHERPLTFDVIFMDSQRRAIPVANELHENNFTVNTADLPGGRGCSLAILATDGSRSAMVRSEPFDLPESLPRVVIVTPRADEVLLPDQPFSLLGAVFDLAGRQLLDEHLVWSIDEQRVAEGQRLAPAGPLEPGDYQVELAYLQDGKAVASAMVRILVTERSPEQEEWLRVSADLANRRARTTGRL